MTQWVQVSETEWINLDHVTGLTRHGRAFTARFADGTESHFEALWLAGVLAAIGALAERKSLSERRTDHVARVAKGEKRAFTFNPEDA